MSSPTKFRATLHGDLLEVRMQLMHEMETGNRKDENGRPIPAHFIRTVDVRLNERTVLAIQCGTSVAKNPFFAFKLHGAHKGDRLRVSWVDNRGDRRSDETTVG